MKKLAYGFVLAFAAMAAANVFAAGALPSGDTNLSILPIPDQLCRAGVEPEPGFTVTNRETGVYWVFAEGGVAPEGCPFEASYSFDNGVGTVTATGKDGGAYEGEILTREYAYTDEFLINGGFESGTLEPGWTGSDSARAFVIDAKNGHKPNQTTTFITGTYCGMLKHTCSMQQVFTCESPCRATLSWKCKHRCDWGNPTVNYKVLLDDQVIYPDEAVTGSDVRYRSVEGLVLSSGEHTLKFDGWASSDTSLFLDDVSLRLTTPLVILPIPDQAYNFGGVYRPEFTVTNVLSAQSWRIGGDIDSGDFDVVYSNNDRVGVATVTVTGKGALEGEVLMASFNIFGCLFAKPVVDVEGDGLSWATAMSWTNALATAAAEPCFVEIWLSGDVTLFANPDTLAFSKSMVIRGGFAGTETHPDERAAGAMSTFDGQVANVVMTINNTAPVVLDGLRIFNGQRGIVKTGAGDLSILNCEIVGNHTSANGQNGIGLSLTGTADAKLVVSNCVVSGNYGTAANIGNGQGLYVATFGSVVIEDTTFLTNGIAWTGKDFWNEGRNGQAGAALYINNAATTVKGCTFRGNRGSGYDNRGGIVRVAGTSGGTLFDHCVFAGNEEDYHWSPGRPSGGKNGGQIAINMSAETDRVTISNCTIAGNFSDNTVSAAGVTVTKGMAVIKNSIIANNIVHPTNTGGADLALVDPTAHAEVSYSVLSADSPSSYISVNVDNLSFGAGMRFGDPALVSSASDIGGLLVFINESFKIRRFDKEKLGEVLGIDVHALSPSGYFTNDGAEHVSSEVLSPAIDAGDPRDPVGSEPSFNGGIVNAGAYGGTAQASKTVASKPAVVDGTVTITFDGQYSRPTVHFTVGGEGMFFATAEVFVSTDGNNWLSKNILYGLKNGVSVDCLIDGYYAPGSSIWVKVVFSASGETADATSSETSVTKDFPPWWGGKGGPANVIHVRPGAFGSGSGENWSDAVPNLRSALSRVSASKNEIWIAGDVALNANPATYTFAAATVIRGGFTGAETLPGERIAGAKSTLDGQVACTVLPFSNAAGAPVVLDGLRIFNGVRGIVKTGAGDLSILNCEIVGNHLIADPQGKGTGLSLTGTADAKLVVSNCIVSGNGSGSNMVTVLGSGQGLYVSSFGSAVIEDSTFLTNGIAWTGRDLWNEGRDGQTGAAIYLHNVQATVRRCTFRGNRGNSYDGRGGIVRVAGTSGGTLFDHCVFAGNEEDYHWWKGVPVGGKNGGQIAINLSGETDRVTINNCTIAGNFSDNSVSAAGITIAKGTAIIKNSIIANNIVHPTNKGGADLALVDTTAHAEVSYSLLSAAGPSSYTSVNVDNLSFGAGVRFGDPSLVSSASDVEGLLVTVPTTTTAQNLRQFNKMKLAEVLDIDVHALSSEGYFTNDGTEHVSDGDLSPAIDAGDPVDLVGSEPMPNGGIVNAGAYGGTAQASKTPPGEPAVEGAVTVTFDGEYSQPTVHFTVGGTGTFYAEAQVYISTNNVDWTLMNTMPGLANGTSVDVPILAYYAPGSVWAQVQFTANGPDATATSEETQVTKPLPPWIGKGGPANVIHVRPGAIGAGTGENWSDAVPNLRSAFSLVSAEKNEIWIAGTNVLKTGSVTLSASNPLVIRGGFHGWENSAAEREDGFRSVIDGDEVTDCLTIANSAPVSIDHILFTRALNCGLIKTGAGDMFVSDCHFITNGMGRATNGSGKGSRVSGTTATTIVTFTNCLFRGNRAKEGSEGGCSASGAGINASSLKCLRLKDCTFVHNGIHLRAPGGGNSSEPSSGGSQGSAVYSTAPVSAVGCQFVANFGNVRNDQGDTKDAGYGGVVRLHAGAEGSAFTNCVWAANGDQIVWQDNGTGGKNIAGPLTVQFGSKDGTVDINNCTFAYNLTDGYEVTAGLNLVLGTANVRNSIFFGNIIGGTSKTRGRDISLRGESVLNVAYTLFGEEGTNSITCAATATTNFLDGVVFGDPLFVTPNSDLAALVQESKTVSATGAKLIFWDWEDATAEATYAALENVNVHLRGGLGYIDERTGALEKAYARGAKSLGIDKGDPKSDYRGEPAGYNGRCVNMGAYGNTP